MADITIRAAYGSVVEDEGQLFVGFAEGEDEAEGYVLFRQALGGGPVWVEVNDETFGAEDAVDRLSPGPKGLMIHLKPALAGVFGWATTVEVRIGPDCEDAAETLAALQAMLGPAWDPGA